MRLESKIYVAGHRGLAGSAIVRVLNDAGYFNLIKRCRDDLDLTDQQAVENFFSTERPEYVFLAAAKVGGILANQSWPAEYIRENLAIQTNVIHAAWRFGVKKLAFLGSSCIYPKHAGQPIREDSLLTGPLEPTNERYAIAKIAGLKMCQAYRRQYGFDAICLMPTNLYGPGDNFSLTESHVLPALIRKFHDAKCINSEKVKVWGTGRPRREFLFSEDFGAAAVAMMARYSDESIVNIGTGDDIAISDLAELVRGVVGFNGVVEYDLGKPDGTMLKRLDVSKAQLIGWSPKIHLADGIRRTYEWFLANLHLVRK